jgi:hypothetical protein
MSTEKTALVDKLILLVLVLILVCLVLVLVQGQFNRSPVSSQPVQTVETEAPQSRQAPPSEISIAAPAPPARPRANATAKTNVVRLTSAPPPGFTAPATAPSIVSDIGLDTSAPSPGTETGPLAGVGTTTGSKNKGTAQIVGRVWISGTLPPEASLAITDPFCGRLQTNPVTSRHYVVTSDGRLADVFVYVKRGLEGRQFPVSTNTPVLDNIKCFFEPYVLGVQASQKFAIKNSDPTLHNMHAMARSNREFNIALANGVTTTRSFATPEVLVRIKCDLHPWMFAYLGVVAHPFFAVTDKDGVFVLPSNLPPGTYTVAAFHPKAGEQTREITIGDGEVQEVEFQYQVNSLSKAH